MFCETSHKPMPMPKKKSDTAVPGTDSAVSERAMPTPAKAASSPLARTVLAVPIRPTTHPAVGRAISEPTAVQRSSVPICPEVTFRISVTAGMRAAQLANTSPLIPKIRNVAAAAAFSFCVETAVVIHSLLSLRVFQVA